MRRQRNHHYLKWIQSSLEEKKNLICCRLLRLQKKIRRVRTHENNSGETVRRLGTIIQSIFVPNQEPAFAWPFGNGPVRVGTQGLFRPCLKTFVPPFLPTRLTAPGSPRMRKGPIIGILGRFVHSKVKITMVRTKFEFRYESLKSKFKPHLHGRKFVARLGWTWYVHQKNSTDYSFTRSFFYRAKRCEIMIWYG